MRLWHFAVLWIVAGFAVGVAAEKHCSPPPVSPVLGAATAVTAVVLWPVYFFVDCPRGEREPCYLGTCP